MSRLSRWFHVVWVEPAHDWRSTTLERPRPSNEMEIYRPEWWLPKLYRPQWLADQLESIRLRRARARLKRKGCRKILLYLWRPNFSVALSAIPHDLSCYHIDDEYSFSAVEQPLSAEEVYVLQRVDHVFIHSQGLFEKKGHINPNTTLVPNGVDYGAFSSPVAEPTDMASIPHPRIGYMGYIKTQLDYKLLLDLVQLHHSWSFVFVGPQGFLSPEDQALIQRMGTYPNVHFLGKKPVTALPAYTQWMDVCIMPYKINDYTKFIFPMKLHEYLATGRPVVGAPIRSLQAFEHVVTLATTSSEWSHALQQALTGTGQTEREIVLRQQVARRYDWGILVRQIAEKICAHFGKPLPTTAPAQTPLSRDRG